MNVEIKGSTKERQSRVRYMHLRRPRITILPSGIIVGPSMKGGVTVAYSELIVPSVNGEKYKHVKFAFARCRTDEHYVKQRGRDEALAKLLADTEWSSVVMLETDLYDHFKRIAVRKNCMRSNLRPEIAFGSEQLLSEFESVQEVGADDGIVNY